MISGVDPASGAQAFASALIDEMAAEGPAPVVAAQIDVAVQEGDEPAPEDGRRTTFVGPIRDGELTRDRVSTVDDLDTAAGLAALVLAMEDLAVPIVGHYGIAPGAQTTPARAGHRTVTDAARTSRAAAGMGAIAAVSRGVGFVRVLVVAAVLGTTYLGNAFQAANSLSNVLFELLAAGALSAVLVPTFVDLLDRGDREGAEEVAGGVLGVALLGLGAVSVVGVVAAPLLARALTLGVPAEVAADQARAGDASCCASSCPRSCSTPPGPSPRPCCTPSAASPSRPQRRSATPW